MIFLCCILKHHFLSHPALIFGCNLILQIRRQIQIVDEIYRLHGLPEFYKVRSTWHQIVEFWWMNANKSVDFMINERRDVSCEHGLSMLSPSFGGQFFLYIRIIVCLTPVINNKGTCLFYMTVGPELSYVWVS